MYSYIENIERLEAKKSSLQTELATLVENRTVLYLEQSKMEEDNLLLKGEQNRLDKFEEKIEQCQNLILNLTNEKENLETVIENDETKITELKTDISHLQDKISQSHLEYINSEQQIELSKQELILINNKLSEEQSKLQIVYSGMCQNIELQIESINQTTQTDKFTPISRQESCYSLVQNSDQSAADINDGTINKFDRVIIPDSSLPHIVVNTSQENIPIDDDDFTKNRMDELNTIQPDHNNSNNKYFSQQNLCTGPIYSTALKSDNEMMMRSVSLDNVELYRNDTINRTSPRLAWQIESDNNKHNHNLKHEELSLAGYF